MPGDDGERLVPVDTGNVCVNVDTAWFAERDLEPPASLDDLTDPAYEGLFVTPSALSSSPGLAFLMTTVAAYGEDWPGYWEDLLANDAKVVDGWTDAYFTDFTGGSGGRHPPGRRSPTTPRRPSPSRRAAATPRPPRCSTPASARWSTPACWPAPTTPTARRALVEFLLGEDVQAALPESMYVFPVRDGVALPPGLGRPTPSSRPTPYVLDPAEIAANRDDWLEQWRDVVTR